MATGVIVCNAQRVLTGEPDDRGHRQGEYFDDYLPYYLMYWDEILLLDSRIYPTRLTPEEFCRPSLAHPLNPYYERLLKSPLLHKITCEIEDLEAVQRLNGHFDLGPVLEEMELKTGHKWDVDDLIRAETDMRIESLSGRMMVEEHTRILLNKACEVSQKTPGKWSIQLGGEWKHIVDSSELEHEDRLTADLALVSCLPVPRADTPLEEVLEFKHDRNDELVALRYSLEELYMEITSASDTERATQYKVELLTNAIYDLNRAHDETWMDKVLASRTVTLDISSATIIPGAVTAALVGDRLNSPLMGIGIGAAQTLLSSIKLNLSLTPEPTQLIGNQVDLRYISSMKTAN